MSTTQETGSQFQELLAELQGSQAAALAKALPADEGNGDEKIAAAAAEGGGQEAGEPKKKDGDVDEGGDKPPMAKSLKVTTETGEQVDAIDATELIKSLTDQVETLGGKLTATETNLAKALTDTLTLVKGQSQLIKSMSERLDALGKTGGGRKAVLTVHEPLAKSQAAAEPEGIKPQELLTKAMVAQKEGRLMAHQVSAVETYINRGAPVPEHLVKAILG